MDKLLDLKMLIIDAIPVETEELKVFEDFMNSLNYLVSSSLLSKNYQVCSNSGDLS